MRHDQSHHDPRLRGKRGRPRKDLPGPDPGHNPGTATQNPRVNGGDERGAVVTPTSARLLDLRGAAAYLCVSEWTVRDLEAAGTIARVRIPLPNNGELRRLLFDRASLDDLIELWKDRRP